MKPEDLRIGDWFLLKPISHTKHPAEPTQIKDIRMHCGEYIINGFYWDQGSFVGYSLKELKPIKLSPEWHDKFGGKTIGGGCYIYEVTPNLSAFILNYDRTRQNWWVEYKNGETILPMPIIINCVHEFQNFWRWNTGKELTIKEK